jgi:tetratricopeptide (TPR) repeat protein
MKILLKTLVPLLLSGVLGCSVHHQSSRDRTQAEELVERGIVLMRGGDVDKAYAAYELAFDTYPLASALDGKGCVAVLKGNFGEAERYFLLAADQNPHYTAWKTNLAFLRELQGRPESALDLYRSYLKKKRFDPKRRSNYSAFLYDKGASLGVNDDALIELRKSVVVGGGAIAIHNVAVAEKH